MILVQYSTINSFEFTMQKYMGKAISAMCQYGLLLLFTCFVPFLLFPLLNYLQGFYVDQHSSVMVTHLRKINKNHSK